MPAAQPLATVLTMIEVDPHDSAFDDPTKPIGPVYDHATAQRLATANNWAIAPDGQMFRRVVPSPIPQRIFEIQAIRSLVDQGTIVICAGGGGIPTMYDDLGRLCGVEAVIDKDLASALLAEQLEADLLVIATDVDGVYTGWGTQAAARLGRVTPTRLPHWTCQWDPWDRKSKRHPNFARRTGREAAIGSLTDIAEIVLGRAGTRVVVTPC